MKLFDCFPFLNEYELLELRLMELNDIVDYFVLVEANRTHGGYPKEFNFEKNKERFKEYLHKIIYVKVEDMPEWNGTDLWICEHFIRNQIMRGLKDKAEIGDKIMVSDVDEIPNVDAIKAVIDRPMNTRETWMTFRQTMFYYYVNNMVIGSWCGTTMADYGSFGNRPQSLRWIAIKHRLHHRGPNIVQNGGWHYSYLCGSDISRVKYKVDIAGECGRGTLSQLAGSLEEIEQKIKTQKDLYGRDKERSRATQQLIDISNNKPKMLNKWLEKYPDFIFK